MRLRTTIAAVLLATAAVAVADEVRRGGSVPWSHDLEAAKALAEKEQRPLFLYFTHDH